MKTCPQCHLRYPTESAFCFVDGATLLAAKDARVGSTIGGRYVVEAVLGQGGMATVYRAQHKLVERPCAIKILSPQFAQDPIVRERFRREARHAQRLAHPNIIEIFDQGETDDGIPFLVMELLVGRTLGDLIRETRLAPKRALPIMIQMARGLARAHDFDVIHRDLKPDNVFLMRDDEVKILDFGIARCTQDSRLTGMGELFGTPQYMAPERRTSDAGLASDLYSLGVVMFEMLTQSVPYDAPEPATVLVLQETQPIPRVRDLCPLAPQPLDELVFALMAKNPRDRPVDAHRVLRDLESIATSLGIEIPEGFAPRSVVMPPSREPDPWEHRTALFERMLAYGFRGGPPADLSRMLESVKSHVREVAALRQQALDEQQRIEHIEVERREARVRFGNAMGELTSDVSRAREEARAARSALDPLHAASQAASTAILPLHRDALHWEGRSGFAEPYLELAAAYRKLAEAVEVWHAARLVERKAEAESVEKERVLADLEYQIRELRAGLETLDRSLEEQRNVSLESISELGRRAEHLEGELLHLATRFCAPLRSKPELGQLFGELEKNAPRASI